MTKRAVRMVFQHRDEHDSQWTTTTSVTTKVGLTRETYDLSVRLANNDPANHNHKDESSPFLSYWSYVQLRLPDYRRPS